MVLSEQETARMQKISLAPKDDGSFRVLVIEDDPQLRAVVETLLQDEGYEVTVAESGEKAIEIARAGASFDLIIADIRMPGIDGLDTLEQIGGFDPGAQSLVMTGYASEEDPIRALHIGVKAYLKKPFSLDDFLAKVRELSEKSRQERQQRKFVQTLGNSLNWALRTSLTEALKSGSHSIIGLIQVVQGLAQRTGLLAPKLPGFSDPWLECATLVGCWRRYGVQGATSVSEPDWPRPVLAILNSLDERWDGAGVPDGLAGESIPIGARLASVALTVWQHGLGLGDARCRAVLESDPGRYDPQVIEALLQEEPTATDSSSRQQLLQLATLLLDNKAFRQAREIYQEVLAGSGVARERIDCLLGLVQASLGENHPNEALQFARRIMTGDDSIGPLSRARVFFDLGVQLCSRGLTAGLECLNQSRALFQTVKIALGVTETSLAISYFGQQPLETSEAELNQYLSNARISNWTPQLHWLLPCLLERCSDERLVRRIVRISDKHAALTLKRIKAGNGLSAEARRRLGVFLEGLLQAPQEPDLPSETASLQFYSLSTFDVVYQGQRLDERCWPTAKVKLVLARLVLDLGRAVSEDTLIDDFWQGELEKGRRNLGWSLTQLRKILREQCGNTATILRRGNTIALSFAEYEESESKSHVWHDCTELETLLAAAESSRTVDADVCAGVLSLYRGSFIPNCYLDWAVRYRDRLEQRLSDFLSKVLQGSDSVPEALRSEVAHRLLEIDPCHQSACSELMSQYIQNGRPEEALRIFKKISNRLRSDLGMEPDIRLLELFYRAELGLASAGTG